MSELPPGKTNGIFGLMFREVGLFCEQAFQWAGERAREVQAATGEGLKGVQQSTDEGFKSIRQIGADDQKRRLVESETRKAEAEAKLLEQIRLAKQAGLDVDNILKQLRERP